MLKVLHALVEQGNTVAIIEHNLEVIKTANWVIDLGPEGGLRGGEIVAVATPEQAAGRRGVIRGVFEGVAVRQTRPRSLNPLQLERESQLCKT